jgi:hypothetical protein
MAQIKITDLAAYADPSSTDVVPVVDVANNITKKISIANLLKNASLGTAALPGIAFDGDPNTGLYSPGADQVAISTNGTGRLFVDANGRVGVGTGSPTSLGTNVTTVEIQGATTTRSGGVRLSSSDSSQKGAFYIYDGVAVLGTETSHPLGLYVGNTERARIDSSGRLGVGTTSPSQLFHLASNNCNFYFQPVSNAEARIQAEGGTAGTGTAITFHNYNGSANGERARIDSSGRLLVGTSSARSNLYTGSLSAALQVEGTTYSTSALSLVANGTGSAQNPYPIVYLGRSRGAAVGSNTIVTSGDEVGAVVFTGADGTNLIPTALIESYVDGTPGANDMPGRLVFSTTADGASTPTERMRISNNGVVTIKNGAVAEIGTLTDGATITPDFSANCNFTVTLGGNRTMANPTNVTAGQSGSLFIVQDGTGSRTLSWGANWDWISGSAPTLTTTLNAIDRVDYICRSATSIQAVFTANYS